MGKCLIIIIIIFHVSCLDWLIKISTSINLRFGSLTWVNIFLKMLAGKYLSKELSAVLSSISAGFSMSLTAVDREE